MHFRQNDFRAAVLVLIALLASLNASIAQAAPQPGKKKPTLAERTQQYFAPRKDLQRGELLTRSDVEGLLKVLKAEKYDTAAVDKLLPSVEPDNSLLARTLRTPNGRQFAAQTAKIPQGYDRLDHLSRLSDGPIMIERLADGPDGYKLIEYLATTNGGSTTGRGLEQVPGGANFNRPTGKIYTLTQLVGKLDEQIKSKPTPQRRR